MSDHRDRRSIRLLASHAPAVFRHCRRGPGHAGAGLAVGRRSSRAAATVADRRSAAAARAALRAARQAGDLSVHGRRAQPVGAVRLQAQAARARRPGRAPRRTPRTSGSPSSRATPSCWARAASSPATGSAAPSSASCCRTWPPRSTTCASSRAWSPTSSITARPSCSSTPAPAASACRAWGPGSPTASAACRAICPASSCCNRVRAVRAAAIRCGGAAFCRRPTRACRC